MSKYTFCIEKTDKDFLHWVKRQEIKLFLSAKSNIPGLYNLSVVENRCILDRIVTAPEIYQVLQYLPGERNGNQLNVVYDPLGLKLLNKEEAVLMVGELMGFIASLFDAIGQDESTLSAILILPQPTINQKVKKWLKSFV